MAIDREARERAEANARESLWKAEMGELADWLYAKDESGFIQLHPFLADMRNGIRRFGDLTEKQEAAVRRWYAKDVEQSQRPKGQGPPLEEGHRMLRGVIVSTKIKSGQYGDTLKMLVELEDGNRIWGTVPRSIHRDAQPGVVVEFLAGVERSDRDEHFGFFSRPTDASTIGTR